MKKYKKRQNQFYRIGNYFGFDGMSYDGNVFHIGGISARLLASNQNGNVPKIVVNNKNILHSEREIK